MVNILYWDCNIAIWTQFLKFHHMYRLQLLGFDFGSFAASRLAAWVKCLICAPLKLNIAREGHGLPVQETTWQINTIYFKESCPVFQGLVL